MKIKKIKIVSRDYLENKKIIVEANLKSFHTINGIEIAIAKNDSSYYPFQAYHKPSGQPLDQPKKLLKEVLPDLEERLQRIFELPDYWERFLESANQQEIIN